MTNRQDGRLAQPQAGPARAGYRDVPRAVERLEEHVGSAVAVRGLERVAENGRDIEVAASTGAAARAD